MVAKVAVWKMHVLNGSMARYFSVTAPEGVSWADELQTEEAKQSKEHWKGPLNAMGCLWPSVAIMGHHLHAHVH